MNILIIKEFISEGKLYSEGDEVRIDHVLGDAFVEAGFAVKSDVKADVKADLKVKDDKSPEGE